MTAERDPRAHWLDDDPFDKRSSPGSHSAARDDGNWRQPHIRVVHATGSGAPFVRMFGFEEQARPIPVHTGSIWHFSKTEINHLTLATLAFTLALAFMFSGGILGALSDPSAFLAYGVLALITFTPGFLIHEIAHKIQARKYGCWAEFRASPSGLRFGVLLAAILGIVFMAPGAVMVAGNTTREQFGKVALAGPVSNVVLWCIGLASAVAFGGAGGIVDDVIYYWMWANGILGALNMLPFGPLDG
ncbi:MAG TPA: hypothetical protein EYM40_03020, partial [Candidatus Poseidoniales archaeon]|nr:hypothetical protein [Candidatus Poseidoniales archaeon]